MILSGNEIRIQREAGKIEISDFNESRLGPNSYNVRLASELMVYTEVILDAKQENRTRTIIIPQEGLVLKPGKLYLGRTMERTKTEEFVPMLEGRSSVGRLGLAIHVTAGFGDVGFDGAWTLEIFCLQPVRIYPEMEIGQIYYHSIAGEILAKYHGKYQGSRGVVASRMFQDWEADHG